MLYLVLPTLYPYTNVPLLQPSSSSGGLSQPIIRLFWPTVLRTSTEQTSAGLSGDDRQSKQFVALCVQGVNVYWQIGNRQVVKLHEICAKIFCDIFFQVGIVYKQNEYFNLKKHKT